MSEPKFTPAPWKWWTANSWRRLKRDDGRITQNVLEPFVARDGHPDLIVSQGDMHLIASSPDLYGFAEHDQWSVVMGALDKWSRNGGSDLVALGIIGQGLLILDEARRAALAKAEGREP